MSDNDCANWAWSTTRVIPSFHGAGQELQDELLAQLRELSWNDQELFAVRLALEEAIVNAIKHGNRHDSCKQVRVRCQASPERLRIEIEDEGCGFDPQGVPDCTEDHHLEVASGRGIMLMRAFMCHVQYNAKGNCVTMEKRRPKES
jgi:serine/threonine-protein kinase RsbW